MKKYKEVDADRRKFRDGVLNSTHRASLLVPEIEGTVAEISFLNHFLLKRGCENVGCRITSLDRQGKRIEARLHKITEPRVYTFTLTGMAKVQVSQYMIEFFCADNLFVPYPAVMVNHRGPRFLNQVHAFNRVLNDVFEDDAINRVHVKETSIDLEVTNDEETFLLFSAGALPCRGRLTAEISNANTRLEAVQDLDLPRFGTKELKIRDLFPNLPSDANGVLKVKTPPQLLFYGRLLAGQVGPDRSFSANHSYYDSTIVEEYWNDGKPSSRLYPYFPELKNKIRMYPVNSPGTLDIKISLQTLEGESLKRLPAGSVTSPANTYLDIDLNQIVKSSGVPADKITSYYLEARSPDGKMPTRTALQLVIGAGGLKSSINETLTNPEEVFIPEGKKGFAWGQAVLSKDVDTFLGIQLDPLFAKTPDEKRSFELKLYGPEGEILSRSLEVRCGGSLRYNLRTDFASELKKYLGEEPVYLWYTLSSERPGVNGFSISRHNLSKQCSGEHSF